MSKKNNSDELIGFRDFLDHTEKKTPPERNPRIGGFEMLTFLERENTRLGKLVDLCQDKSYVIKNFPQHEVILKKLEDKRNETLEILAKKLAEKDSTLSENLDELLQQHFNS